MEETDIDVHDTEARTRTRGHADPTKEGEYASRVPMPNMDGNVVVRTVGASDQVEIDIGKNESSIVISQSGQKMPLTTLALPTKFP